jgi:steroid delta-isomerase-like uncharacterized protein
MAAESGRRIAPGRDELHPRVERAIRAFNDHDLDRLDDEFAPGGTFADPLTDAAVTGDAMREYTRGVFEAFPDVTIEVRRVVASTETDVAMEVTYVGTHDGPLEGIPPTGRRVAVQAVTVIELDADGIASWRDYFDQVAFREQLGLTFPAIIAVAPELALEKLRSLA